MAKNSGRPPGDDAWAGLEDSDEWARDKTPPPSGRQTADLPENTAARLSRPSLEAGRFQLQGVTQDGNHFLLDLSQSPMTLGRSSRNPLVVPDSSVSREHARIEREGDNRFSVTDLGSGNGTFVGGRRVDRVSLGHGDEIVFGQISMRLVDTQQASLGPFVPGRKAPGFSPPQQDGGLVREPHLARARATQLARGLFGAKKGRVALLLVCLVVWGGLFTRNRRLRSQAFAQTQLGLQAFNAGHWDKAEQNFAAALATAPGYALAMRYADAVAKVRNDAQRLAEVAGERGAGRLPEARTLLASVGSTALLNEVLAQAEALRAASDQIVEQAETALEAGLDAEGRALLARLGTPPPPRPDVGALHAWMAAKGELGPLAERAHNMPKGMRPRSLMLVAETQRPAMRRAIQAFRRSRPETALGAVERALGRPTSPPESELMRSVVAMTRLYRTGMGEHRGKRAFAAIKLFTEARQLAQHVAGDNSEPARGLGDKLADMYYVLGVTALGADQLAEASEALHTALTLSPHHPLSRRKIGELEVRAQKLVGEASLMQVTHTNRARELCRKVIEAMPANSAAARQARALDRRLH